MEPFFFILFICSKLSKPEMKHFRFSRLKWFWNYFNEMLSIFQIEEMKENVAIKQHYIFDACNICFLSKSHNKAFYHVKTVMHECRDRAYLLTDCRVTIFRSQTIDVNFLNLMLLNCNALLLYYSVVVNVAF